jgi:outer membrane murein-binding lipoprotein Lpp
VDPFDDKLQELEKKIAFMEDCHREQVRFLVRCINELEEKVNELSSMPSELAAVERVAFDAYAIANEDVQATLFDAHKIVRLGDRLPHQAFFNQVTKAR